MCKGRIFSHYMSQNIVKLGSMSLTVRLYGRLMRAAGTDKIEIKEHVKDLGKAAIIHPADVAFISRSVINHLINIYKKNRPKIAVVSYGKRAGHPILFDKTMFDEVLGISEEEMGLKSVVRRHKNEILYIPVDEEEVLIDIDTIDDIKRYVDSKRK